MNKEKITCEQMITRLKEWEDYRQATRAADRLGAFIDVPDHLKPVGRWRLATCQSPGCQAEGFEQCILDVEFGDQVIEKAWEGWCFIHGWWQAEVFADGLVYEQAPRGSLIELDSIRLF